MSDPGTGKVKRLRHTPTVKVAASTLRGQVMGPDLGGVAVAITGAEADRGRRHITATNRLAWFFLQRKARRAGWDWVVYAVRRDQPDDQPSNDQSATDCVDVDDTRTTNSQENR